MYIKALLLSTLIVLSFGYTEQGSVIVLGDDDFPGIFQEFSHILIEFYAPWCGHCKKLAPVYTQVGKQLKAQGSIVRVAKLDATEHPNAAQKYGVKGYPTLYFFLNGEKVDYSGQRSKDSMVNWLLKKTRDPVSEITKEQYEALATSGLVSIVYHGDFATAENAEILNKIAISDDYNTYNFVKNSGKEEGTVEVIRSFAEAAVYGALDAGLASWLSKNQRPPVVPFDDRSIGEIFGQQKLGVILFNARGNAMLLEQFTQAAKQYAETDGEPLIFTEIPKGNEHIENFANYIKVSHQSHPVIVIETATQSKYVMKSAANKENILEFLDNYSDFKYGITDQVKAAAQMDEDL